MFFTAHKRQFPTDSFCLLFFGLELCIQYIYELCKHKIQAWARKTSMQLHYAFHSSGILHNWVMGTILIGRSLI